MNRAILKPEVQAFIESNLNADPSRLRLGKSPFPDISPAELAQQIESKRISRSKLPAFFNTPGIYYPPKLSIEQSSSEPAAAFKATLIGTGTLADLTGGIGIDTLYFSRRAGHVTHCEINPELSDIATHNHRVLNALNIGHIAGDGIEFLRDTDLVFDTIYLDPSRRVEQQKVFFLADCEPNVIENFDLICSRARSVLIKTAPMLDISAGLKELAHVSDIYVVSLKNECKEILWLIEPGFGGDASIHCVGLRPRQERLNYTFTVREERDLEIERYSTPQNYLYEPDAAVMKAGAFKLITRDLNVSKLSQHTHLYTSEVLQLDFPGRIFRIEKVHSFGDFQRSGRMSKANIATRNFPQSPEQLRRKLRIGDGGDIYLFFCKGPADELLVLETKKAHQVRSHIK